VFEQYTNYMKTILFLSLLTASLGIARAQDATYDDTGVYPTDSYAAPAVVYNAPVTYVAPVTYQAPVIYYAPVFYGTPASYALNACAACENTAVCSTLSTCSPRDTIATRSTVTYIGGGGTRFQVAPRCNTGSTVTYIGGSWFASH
jgi:hypothetical protein